MNKKIIYSIILIILLAGIIYLIMSKQKEAIICTMEYAPVCGTDNVIYSNTCMAESQGIEIAYSGECHVLGGDKDEHGCIATAGYTWCDSKQKCLRLWEEKCTGSQIANPASVNCENKGGELIIKTKADGEYGVCVFEDDKQCEEWSLFNNECAEGGVKILDYDSEEEVYCAITGGEVNASKNICVFDESHACVLDEYYKGICTK